MVEKKPLTLEEQNINLVRGMLVVCGVDPTILKPAQVPIAVRDFIKTASNDELQALLLEVVTLLREAEGA